MARTQARKARQGTSLPVAIRGAGLAFASSAPADAASVQRLCSSADLAHWQRAILLTAARRPDAPGFPHVHVAAHGPTGILIGLCACLSPIADSASVCCVVDAPYRGRGLGTTLLRLLAASAHDRGIARLTADLPMSHRQEAMNFLLDSGFRSTWEVGGELLHAELDLAAPRPGWSPPEREASTTLPPTSG